MVEFEFLMTYPCYFVRDDRGRPDVVQFEEKLCACLFTDTDVLGTFYQDKLGKSDAWLKVCVMKSAAELLLVLQEWQPLFRASGVFSIAFDLSPGKQPVYVSYVSLMEALQVR